jgi:hypothetical protein
MSRKPNPLPEGPLKFDKACKLVVVKRMLIEICDALLREIEDVNSEVYNYVDNYVDTNMHNIDNDTRLHIRKTYRREVEVLATAARKLKLRTNSKEFSGGRKKSENI